MVYDLCMLSIVAFTTFRGATKGMAWQLAAIAALVLCFLFATPMSLVFAPMIPVDAPLNRWIAILAIYLVFSFGCFAAARAVRSGLESMKFEDYDKHLGGLFGLIKGATICVVITFFSVCLSERACEYVMRTRSGYASAVVLHQLQPVMPRELAGIIDPYLQHMVNEVREIVRDEPRNGDDSSSRDPFETQHDAARESPGGFRGSTRPPEGHFAETDDFRRPVRDTERVPDANEPSRRGDSNSLSDLVKRIPDLLGDKFKQAVNEAVRGALPDSSSNSAGTGKQPPPRTDMRPADTERLRPLIEEIGRLFARRDDQRQKFAADIESLLEGVPGDVSLAALADWRADLLGREPDPDPRTDVTWSLDARLVRQLDSAGVRLSELPARLRERLEKAGE
jgi:uncharacterized membrane protein required for colicin V production